MESRPNNSSEDPAGIENLQQGDDLHEIEFWYETKRPKVGKNGNTYWLKDSEHSGSIEASWDEIFAYLAPELIRTIGDSLGSRTKCNTI